MIPSASITLSRANGPIDTPVTKFGGEPGWLEEPRWPVSRHLGVPMTFLGQVALADVPSLPESLRHSSRVAYLFMTESDGAVVHTCKSEGGENAVIIQPGGAPAMVTATERATNLNAEWVECAVRLTPREEPERVDPRTGRLGLAGAGLPAASEGEENAVRERLRVNKLGGVPCFIQDVEYPPGGAPWHFILQLDEENAFADGEFNPSFDGGRAHVFVSEDGREGRLLWQYQP